MSSVSVHNGVGKKRWELHIYVEGIQSVRKSYLQSSHVPNPRTWYMGGMPTAYH